MARKYSGEDTAVVNHGNDGDTAWAAEEGGVTDSGVWGAEITRREFLTLGAAGVSLLSVPLPAVGATILAASEDVPLLLLVDAQWCYRAEPHTGDDYLTVNIGAAVDAGRADPKTFDPALLKSLLLPWNWTVAGAPPEPAFAVYAVEKDGSGRDVLGAELTGWAFVPIPLLTDEESEEPPLIVARDVHFERVFAADSPADVLGYRRETGEETGEHRRPLAMDLLQTAQEADFPFSHRWNLSFAARGSVPSGVTRVVIIPYFPSGGMPPATLRGKPIAVPYDPQAPNGPKDPRRWQYPEVMAGKPPAIAHIEPTELPTGTGWITGITAHQEDPHNKQEERFPSATDLTPAFLAAVRERVRLSDPSAATQAQLDACGTALLHGRAAALRAARDMASAGIRLQANGGRAVLDTLFPPGEEASDALKRLVFAALQDWTRNDPYTSDEEWLAFFRDGMKRMTDAPSVHPAALAEQWPGAVPATVGGTPPAFRAGDVAPATDDLARLYADLSSPPVVAALIGRQWELAAEALQKRQKTSQEANPPPERSAEFWYHDARECTDPVLRAYRAGGGEVDFDPGDGRAWRVVFPTFGAVTVRVTFSGHRADDRAVKSSFDLTLASGHTVGVNLWFSPRDGWQIQTDGVANPAPLFADAATNLTTRVDNFGVSPVTAGTPFPLPVVLTASDPAGLPTPGDGKDFEKWVEEAASCLATGRQRLLAENGRSAETARIVGTRELSARFLPGIVTAFDQTALEAKVKDALKTIARERFYPDGTASAGVLADYFPEVVVTSVDSGLQTTFAARLTEIAKDYAGATAPAELPVRGAAGGKSAEKAHPMVLRLPALLSGAQSEATDLRGAVFILRRKGSGAYLCPQIGALVAAGSDSAAEVRQRRENLTVFPLPLTSQNGTPNATIPYEGALLGIETDWSRLIAGGAGISGTPAPSTRNNLFIHREILLAAGGPKHLLEDSARAPALCFGVTYEIAVFLRQNGGGTPAALRGNHPAQVRFPEGLQPPTTREVTYLRLTGVSPPELAPPYADPRAAETELLLPVPEGVALRAAELLREDVKRFTDAAQEGLEGEKARETANASAQSRPLLLLAKPDQGSRQGGRKTHTLYLRRATTDLETFCAHTLNPALPGVSDAERERLGKVRGDHLMRGKKRAERQKSGASVARADLDLSLDDPAAAAAILLELWNAETGTLLIGETFSTVERADIARFTLGGQPHHHLKITVQYDTAASIMKTEDGEVTVTVREDIISELRAYTLVAKDQVEGGGSRFAAEMKDANNYDAGKVGLTKYDGTYYRSEPFRLLVEVADATMPTAQELRDAFSLSFWDTGAGGGRLDAYLKVTPALRNVGKVKIREQQFAWRGYPVEPPRAALWSAPANPTAASDQEQIEWETTNQAFMGRENGDGALHEFIIRQNAVTGGGPSPRGLCLTLRDLGGSTAQRAFRCHVEATSRYDALYRSFGWAIPETATLSLPRTPTGDGFARCYVPNRRMAGDETLDTPNVLMVVPLLPPWKVQQGVKDEDVPRFLVFTQGEWASREGPVEALEAQVTVVSPDPIAETPPRSPHPLNLIVRAPFGHSYDRDVDIARFPYSTYPVEIHSGDASPLPALDGWMLAMRFRRRVTVGQRRSSDGHYVAADLYSPYGREFWVQIQRARPAFSSDSQDDYPTADALTLQRSGTGRREIFLTRKIGPPTSRLSPLPTPPKVEYRQVVRNVFVMALAVESDGLRRAPVPLGWYRSVPDASSGNRLISVDPAPAPTPLPPNATLRAYVMDFAYRRERLEVGAEYVHSARLTAPSATNGERKNWFVYLQSVHTGTGTIVTLQVGNAVLKVTTVAGQHDAEWAAEGQSGPVTVLRGAAGGPFDLALRIGVTESGSNLVWKFTPCYREELGDWKTGTVRTLTVSQTESLPVTVKNAGTGGEIRFLPPSVTPLMWDALFPVLAGEEKEPTTDEQPAERARPAMQGRDAAAQIVTVYTPIDETRL